MKPYRGKSHDNEGKIEGEWIYGFLAAPDQIMVWNEDNATGKMFQVYPETIGQQTGKKDESKTDIYQGDELDGGFYAMCGGEVFWDEEDCSFSERNYHAGSLPLKNTSGRKITGNIYNTPKLLEEKK